jgi:hypothetical protein
LTHDIVASSEIEGVVEMMLDAVGNYAKPLTDDRQKRGLNSYLDEFAGKLKVKNWAKLASVSVDTAEKDVKALVSAQCGTAASL